MKTMRKIATLLLALALILSLAAPVFAADEDTYTITINNATDGHTYEAYQIFTGDLSEGILSNIEWGSGVSADGQTAMGDAAVKADTLTDKDAAEAFAKEVAPYLTTAAGSDNTVTDGKYVISGLTSGYYLVKDQNGSLDGDNDSYTSYILVVVEDTEVTPKASVPSVEKKVDDINDSNDTEDEINWQDSADHDIGDDVSFQLTATLADNVSAYATYKIVFHDTLSAGLTYNDNAKVYFGDTDVTSYFTITEENGSLTISCDNVKAFGATDSSVITVEYTATLNSGAVLGSAGNPNVVYLEYSNNPNWEPEYWDDDDNPDTPDVPKNPGDTPTGNTPEDKVIVFTFKVVVNKVDENNDALKGAGFTLYKKNAAGEYVAIGEELFGGEQTEFTWTGLDDGEYKLVESTTPAGYNTIDPIEFIITAEHDAISDNPTLTKLEGGEMFTGEVSTGTLSAAVENKSGATLPETGGIGTTIFYALGAIMVLGAVVLLVTKKRMAA